MSKYSRVPFGAPKRTTARKEHTCTSCGSKIEAGETYFKEEQFLRYLSRPIVEVCETCHNEGRFDLSFLEQRQSAEPPKGPIDRFL